MGNRLTKIYTKTGDQGNTTLSPGSTFMKNSPRIHAIGDVDELNSVIGFLRSANIPDKINKRLAIIQHDLFDIGGELSMPGHSFLSSSIIDELEVSIDNYNSELPPLKNFILPAGCPSASTCHMARSICRRAERSIVDLNQQEVSTHLDAQKYLNRLSDFLFVLCRVLSKNSNSEEVYWSSRHVR